MNSIYIIKETYTNGYTISSIDLLTLAAILSAISVIVSKNPIVSVLFLISLFVCVAIYLIILGISFIGLSYLLVYVGAISILFLFILMLINIRISELLSETRNSIPLVLLIAPAFTLPLSQTLPFNGGIDNTENSNFLGIVFSMVKGDNVQHVTNNSWDGNVMETSHITSIGSIMYTNYAMWLIITSLILLLAMVGAIVITIRKENCKSLPVLDSMPPKNKSPFIKTLFFFFSREKFIYIIKTWYLVSLPTLLGFTYVARLLLVIMFGRTFLLPFIFAISAVLSRTILSSYKGEIPSRREILRSLTVGFCTGLFLGGWDTVYRVVNHP